ncbi:PaaX family transcriptional regulator [Rhodococcus sp. OK302]|uniref:PaaX family transcriptional regulator n=1 Tax=Rhodococcus sp. OK302 TaxID=1882769 RepID=UPI000B93EF0F|nr:PaaX family transcriptional regulator C-terminal domain-containing protein [Rhodococcus sp. OK302]OYD67119.1 PaaX family transcriptional regulator [Rhodococcus sp. OK302]
MTVVTKEHADGDARTSDPAPRQLIVTLFGLYGRAEKNWLSVASLVRLMAELGVDGPAVRSSISRLKRREILLSSRHGTAAGYSMSPLLLDVLAEGDARIFGRSRATVDDGWLLVVFSVPESERENRHALRTVLTRLGFGTAAPGVWIAPGNVEREVRETLERRQLHGYVDIFSGNHVAFGDLRSKVRDWWDLDELTALYAEFIDAYRPILAECSKDGFTPREAFAHYVAMLTMWRRLPYRDPGLPLDLLPKEWNSVVAEELFRELNTALSGHAREHALATIHG